VTKVRVGIRLPAEVIANFKPSGDGWQTRIDAALRQFIEKNTNRSLKASTQSLIPRCA
jgi:uncharacterized protein (DUF4415 family)